MNTSKLLTTMCLRILHKSFQLAWFLDDTLFRPNRLKQTWVVLATLALISLSGCPGQPEPESPDAGTMNAGTRVAGGSIEAGDPGRSDPEDECVDRNDCTRPECIDHFVCQSCEAGGNCAYSGVLKVFGNVLSKSGQLISNLNIKAICGATQIETTPGEEGLPTRKQRIIGDSTSKLKLPPV